MKMYYVEDCFHYHSGIFSTRRKAESWAKRILDEEGFTIDLVYYPNNKNCPDEHNSSGFRAWKNDDDSTCFTIEEYEVDDES